MKMDTEDEVEVVIKVEAEDEEILVEDVEEDVIISSIIGKMII
jgi:hypothetical protein